MIRISIESTWDGDAVSADFDRLMHELARRLAEHTAEEARVRCPVDTGRLRDGIEVRPDGDDFAVVATAPHSAAIELGSARNRTGPRPFLIPALDSASKEVPSLARGMGFDVSGEGVSNG